MPTETKIDLPRPMAYVTREDARNLEAGIADCILMMREQTGRFERPVYASPEQSNAVPPTKGKVEALGEVAIIQCWACRSEFALEALEANDGCCPACDSDIDLGGYVTRLQAENAALQQRLNVADQRVDDLQSERDALKAEVGRLTDDLSTRTADLLECGTKRKRVQSDLTKARELLSEVCDSIANPDHYRKVFAYLDPSARAAKPSLQADEIHQMAFEEGQPAENGDGYLFTAEEFDLFVERLLTSQSAPAATCETCGGTKVVDDGELLCSSGGIPFENGPIKCVKDCPDCAPAANAVFNDPLYNAESDARNASAMLEEVLELFDDGVGRSSEELKLMGKIGNWLGRSAPAAKGEDGE